MLTSAYLKVVIADILPLGNSGKVECCCFDIAFSENGRPAPIRAIRNYLRSEPRMAWQVAEQILDISLHELIARR